MAAPTLGFRVGIFGGIVFAGVAIVAAFLALLFFIGLNAIPPASLAIGVLVLIALAAGIALTLVFAANLIAVGLIAFVLFVAVALVAAPPVAIIAVILFLVLLALTLAVVGNPLNIPFFLLLLLLMLIPFTALMVGILGPGSLLVVIAVIGFIGLGLFVAWLLFRIHPMPKELLGLGGLSAMPAVPLATVPDFIEAVVRLKDKEAQRLIPEDAMTNVFTLGAGTPHARTAPARTFLFGGEGDNEEQAKQYSLDLPAQFDMGWTTFAQVDTRAGPLLSTEFQTALTTPAVANAEFWLNVSRYWGAFGIAPMALVRPADVPRISAMLGAAWVPAVMNPLIASGSLFVLDMTIFVAMDPPNASWPRFTPATLAFFRLDTTAAPGAPALRLDTTGATMPTFTPFLIQVSDGVNTQVYTPAAPTTTNAWLYALQALKVSTTVWGIWLGHVYRYHVVTAAMQMTMYEGLPRLHPVRQVLGLQSKYTIGFDTVLFIDWSFPPPTSCGTSIQLLQLCDSFARLTPAGSPPGTPPGRPFFADDPETDLLTLGLPKDSFSNPVCAVGDINLPAFASRLNAARTAPAGTDPVSVLILSLLPGPANAALATYTGGENPAIQAAIAAVLNGLIGGLPLIGTAPFAGVTPGVDTATETARLPAPRTNRLNRLLLQDAYPIELWIFQWNLYPLAHYVVSIYRAAARYIGTVVPTLYPTPAAITADAQVRRWMRTSATVGNVQGLPGPSTTPFTTPAQLASVLTSLIYRITAHGLARLAPVGNPGLTWVGNFPPCLEDSRIPDPLDPAGTGVTAPATDLSMAQLLAFLPKTGTIGEMLAFIFSFGFTDTFEPLIPVPSANTTGLPDMELNPFIGLPPACDTALQRFRAEMTGFMRYFMADMNALNRPAMMNFSATSAQIHQWEMNIEQ